MKNIHIQKNKGFTLLFAMLVATLVVAIGATIISIALRQTILSGTSRESQYAFYAANTAMECARYWDTNVVDGSKKVFPILTEDISVTTTDTAECSKYNILQNWEETDLDGTKKWTFDLQISNQENSFAGKGFNHTYCAEVIVTKSDNGSVTTTTIESKGYNTCDTTNSRRVERGLIEQYQS